MPTVVMEATKFMVLVCEERYQYSIWDDKNFYDNAHKIVLNAMDDGNEDVWYEYWIVEKGQDAKDHPARNAHELHGRQWREC